MHGRDWTVSLGEGGSKDTSQSRPRTIDPRDMETIARHTLNRLRRVPCEPNSPLVNDNHDDDQETPSDYNKCAENMITGRHLDAAGWDEIRARERLLRHRG